MQTLLSIGLTLLIALLVGACDGGDLEQPATTLTGSEESAPEVLLDENSLLIVDPAQIISASANGDRARVRLPYKANVPATWFTRSRVELHVRLQSAGVVHSSAAVDVLAGATSDYLDLHVPATNTPFEIIASLYQPRLDRIVHTVQQTQSLDLELADDPALNLGKGAEIYPYLVPGSYQSEVTGDRLVHRFSLQVFDRHPDDPDRISIGGLHTDPAKFFRAYENNYHDVESPIAVDSRRNRVQIYFVLDASYSIVVSEAQDALKRAASRSVLALRDVAEYDYRQFSGQVRGIDSIDGMVFDNGTSATALYFALDDTLQDIETYAAPSDFKIVIAFTDGRDFASLNHYPELNSDDAMKLHITDRIRKVRDQQAEIGGGLQLHLVSVADADTSMLDQLAVAGDGVHRSAAEWSGVDDAFDAIARRILSTYFLEYSSQRTAGDSFIEVEVNVNGNPKRIPVNP